jgi:tetratricopeptide (TPR) repeat protein
MGALDPPQARKPEPKLRAGGRAFAPVLLGVLLGVLLSGAGMLLLWRQSNASHTAIAVELAGLYQALGKPEDAIRLLDAAAETGIWNATSLRQAGHTHLALGQTEAAAGALERAARLKPRDREIKADLAHAYRMAGRTQDAETLYRQMIRQEPTDYLLYQELGQLYEALERDDEAQALYRELELATPDRPEGPLYQALLYDMRSRQCSEALPHYQRALEKSPSNIWIIEITAQCLLQEGDGAAAAELFQTVLEATDGPDQHRLYYMLGESYLAQGQLAEAAEAYEASIALRANWASSRIGLGKARLALGDCDAALPQFREALALAPNDQEAQDGLDACLKADAAGP